jgi:hypothetical protein
MASSKVLGEQVEKEGERGSESREEAGNEDGR